MDSNNWPEGIVRVIWEGVPGDSEYVFREITQEDIDPCLYTPGSPVNTAYFPLYRILY